MSDTKTWWAEPLIGVPGNVWAVWEGQGKNPIGSKMIAHHLDKPTAHKIAAVNELEAALKQIVKEWDGEPEDMYEARMALAKAKGDA